VACQQLRRRCSLRMSIFDDSEADVWQLTASAVIKGESVITPEHPNSNERSNSTSLFYQLISNKPVSCPHTTFNTSCCKVNRQNYLEVCDIHSDYVFKFQISRLNFVSCQLFRYVVLLINSYHLKSIGNKVICRLFAV
jgi:hypothetical protein